MPRALTNEQKKSAIEFMNAHQGDDFKDIASFLSTRFGVEITASDCCRLFMDALFKTTLSDS